MPLPAMSMRTEVLSNPTLSCVSEMIGATFNALPDDRLPSNATKFVMSDAALSAFAVFFTQSPSWLDWQTRMDHSKGKNNANTLFGVHKIPSDTQVRNLLDPVPAATLFPLMAEIGDYVFDHGYLSGYRALGDTLLVALDGTDFHSSKKISCPCCLVAKQSNGDILYRHIAVTPVIVAPGQGNVIALPPQFVEPQDGHNKQDCELAASGRWLAQWGRHYAARGMTVLGDDLYCHQPFCQQVRAVGAHYLFTCKPGSHSTLYEWVTEIERIGGVKRHVVARRIGKKLFTDTYRYAADLPLKDGEDALLVNWCELVTTNEDGDVVYTSAWATSHTIDAQNVVAVAVAGRTRWKIENENNNTLKTKGYHLEHNFGHGKKNLANLFATMNLMAFLLHTVLEMTDVRYRAVRNALPSRRTFFEHLRALTHYFPFDSWHDLIVFMYNSLAPPTPKTG